MGVFDDILGGDEEEEREEMQENIEKIREKVQEGRQAREPSEGGGPPEPPVRPGDIRGEEAERGERPERRERRAAGFEEPPGPAEPAGGEERRSSPERPEPEGEGPSHEDVPEPPEVKELDVPDIEKGPLFITVDKFRDALETISDMRRVAADMDDYIGSMEGTLQEDRDTEEGIRRILDEAEEDTENLKDIVSP